ncbi:MAG TPA: class I SAM-dependent methyltransferase [Patescibacteria group bacterium]|nr:class I SAM-dependent methyltransferase [Patescibacteria group bacterium]
MEAKDFWDGWWQKHEEEIEWDDNPSIFAQFAVSYFPKEGNILELGAGLGKDTRYFAHHGYHVVSTDFSEKALSISKWEATFQKITSVDYQNIDIKKPLPFDTDKFDVVYAHAVLHYFSHEITDQIFREIHRVLKNQGVFATLLKSKEDPEIEKSLKLKENFYQTPQGLVERFFTVEEVKKETDGLFKPVVLDSSEQTHESENATFIRYIGLKISKGEQAPH